MKRLLVCLALSISLSFAPAVLASDGNTETPGVVGNTETPGAAPAGFAWFLFEHVWQLLAI
jgi:hypothetical protein